MMYTVSLELGSTSQRPDLCFCLFCYIECKYARIEGHRHQKNEVRNREGVGNGGPVRNEEGSEMEIVLGMRG